MRCPSCGTENAPDSRFCGVCGRQQSAAPQQQRLAPTAKIPDDAPLAPPTRGPNSGQHPHVSYAPPAMPTPPPGAMQQGKHGIPPHNAFAAPAHPSGPQAQRPSSHDFGGPTPVANVRQPSPPTVQRPQPRPQSSIGEPPNRKPMASNASMSFSAPPHRPLGLIAVVLIIDLGLAGAGAFLLAKGLAKKEDAKALPSPPPAPAKPEQRTELTPDPAPRADIHDS